MEEVRVRVSYKEFIEQLEKRLYEEGGLVRGVSTSLVRDEIRQEIEFCRGQYRQDLRQDWPIFFPKIPFSETALEAQLDDFLREKEREILAKFEWLGFQERQWIRFRRWLFRREQIEFLAGAFVSCFTLPLFFALFFAPSNTKLAIGFWGGILNVSAFGFLWWRNHRSYKRVR